MHEAIILIQTLDRKGLLAEISSFFYAKSFNILQCQQYTDLREGRYFMRMRIDLTDLASSRKQFEEDFCAFATTLNLNYSIHYNDRKRRLGIMVSKTSHCLYDILAHVQEGDLDCEVPLVISNHPNLEHVADKFKIPFFCFPMEAGRKAEQEAKVIEALERHHVDLVVMARYMQVLSEEFVGAYPERIINIHHAFLPAFQGGNPYLRAWERGVKMIGATAHYATAELDEGPIIEQDVEPISHEKDPDDLKRIGKDIERRVLTRAIQAHLENRIITTGRRTIVFSK